MSYFDAFQESVHTPTRFKSRAADSVLEAVKEKAEKAADRATGSD
jgi:hypothetical protein